MPLLVEFENGSWSAYDADRWTGGNAIDKAHLWKGDEKVADVRTYTTIEKIDQEVYEALLDAFYGDPELEVEVLPGDDEELADAIAAFVDAFGGSEEAPEDDEAEAINDLADAIAGVSKDLTVRAAVDVDEDGIFRYELEIDGIQFLDDVSEEALALAATSFAQEDLAATHNELGLLLDKVTESLAGIIGLHALTDILLAAQAPADTADDAA